MDCNPEFDTVNLTVVEDDFDWAEFDCVDCGLNTEFDVSEYYMVHDEVWVGEAGMGKTDGMLCIGCLETRINRELNSSDFTDFPINYIASVCGSSRLINRLQS